MSVLIALLFAYNAFAGVLFDGNNDFITTTLNPSWTDAATYTFYTRFTYSDNGATQVLFGQYDDANNRVQLQITSGDALQFLFVIGSTVKQTASIETLTDGACYTVTFVKNAGVLQIFLNGTEVTYFIQDTYTLGTKSLTSNIFIGARDDTPNLPFAGKMYSAIVYDVALTNSEIALHAKGNPITLFYRNSTVVAYDMLGTDGATVARVRDISGNGNYGTGTNGPVYVSTNAKTKKRR